MLLLPSPFFRYQLTEGRPEELGNYLGRSYRRRIKDPEVKTQTTPGLLDDRTCPHHLLHRGGGGHVVLPLETVPVPLLPGLSGGGGGDGPVVTEAQFGNSWQAGAPTGSVVILQPRG